jgi:hypothetical protein
MGQPDWLPWPHSLDSPGLSLSSSGKRANVDVSTIFGVGKQHVVTPAKSVLVGQLPARILSRDAQTIRQKRQPVSILWRESCSQG